MGLFGGGGSSSKTGVTTNTASSGTGLVTIAKSGKGALNITGLQIGSNSLTPGDVTAATQAGFQPLLTSFSSAFSNLSNLLADRATPAPLTTQIGGSASGGNLPAPTTTPTQTIYVPSGAGAGGGGASGGPFTDTGGAGGSGGRDGLFLMLAVAGLALSLWSE